MLQLFLSIGCQNLAGRLISFHVCAVAPFLKVLHALAVCFQFFVDETVCVGADYASHGWIIHDG
jgi:hypothetical protein